MDSRDFLFPYKVGMDTRVVEHELVVKQNVDGHNHNHNHRFQIDYDVHDDTHGDLVIHEILKSYGFI